MRLLLLTQDFPPDVGGTQTYAYELARRFARQCEDFAVMAPAVPGAAEADAKLPFEVIRLSAGYDTFTLVAYRALPRLLSARPFDASFHVQWPHALAALRAQKRGLLKQVFVAAHGRELLLQPVSLPPFRQAYAALRHRALRRADHLFPVSAYTAGLLRELGVLSTQITVVNNGTDPAQFRPEDATERRAALGVTDRKVLLTVCRLVERKGIDTVIEALPALVSSVPSVVYLVGGSGPDQARLARLAEAKGVSDRVRFLGRLPYEVLGSFYNAADVFVMPAREDPPQVEGFGIVFLEASACARPVVGARSGGIPDAIVDGQTGLLVPPDDPAALATTLSGLLNDPTRCQKLGRQGRLHVEAQGNWDHAAAQLMGQMAETLEILSKD